MTDATDPLLRDPLVQYLGILRAQHADYHPLTEPELAALVEPYLVASRGIADLVVAAVDSLGDRGLEEVVGLLRAMILPIVTAGSPESATGEAVAYVEVTMREQHPAKELRFYVEERLEGCGIRDREQPNDFANFEDDTPAELQAIVDELNTMPSTRADWHWDEIEATS